MADKIKVKVDVTKLDKDRFFKGKKGTYCDLVLIPTPESQFGTWGIVQESTKEERDSGVKMPFVGNADYIQRRNNDSTQTTQNFSGSQASQSQRPMANSLSSHSQEMVADGDEIPF